MTQYSTAQKLCLAGMVVGSILLAVGGGAPYWLITDPDGFGVFGSVVNKVAKANMGPFMYCVELLGESECRLFDWDAESDIDIPGTSQDNETLEWLLTVRITTAVCVVVGLLCGFSALCLACCTCCERFILLGVLAFGAAGCGVYAAVVWSMRTDDITQEILGFKLFSWGWAFFVFCAGLGFLGLVSFMACFASPDANRVHAGMVMQPTAPPPQLAIVTTSVPPPPNMYTAGGGPSHPHSVPEQVSVMGSAPATGSKF